MPEARESTIAGPGWRGRIRGSLAGNLVVVGLTALAVFTGWWLTRPDPAEDDVSRVEVAGAAIAPRVGEAAPNFTATTTDGRELELSRLQGRPVWLVFMATWCTACRAEMPDVQRAQQQAGPDGVEVIAVFVGEDPDAVRTYAARLGLELAQIPDGQTTLSAAYGVQGVPAHYFVDATGIIRHAWVGMLGPAQIDEALAKVAAR